MDPNKPDGRGNRWRWLTGRPGRIARALAGAGLMSAGLLAAAVTAPPQWVRIATGEYFTCGIREGNTLWCWGRQTHGELGTGQPGNASLPQQITRKTSGWASVTAADAHACAARSDGGLWCWGYNQFGQLGLGNTNQQSLPQQVTS